MEALLRESQGYSVTVVPAAVLHDNLDKAYELEELPVKPFRRYVQRVWNALDVVDDWQGALPDLEEIRAKVDSGKMAEVPAPFGLKNDVELKSYHLAIIPTALDGHFKVIKLMTFAQAQGYKTLGAIVQGEARQLDLPDGILRGKAARVALHRFILGLGGWHITNCEVVGDQAADPAEGGPKKRLLTPEEIDAGYDLIREEGCKLTDEDLFFLVSFLLVENLFWKPDWRRDCHSNATSMF